jgi:hypothetical protein
MRHAWAFIEAVLNHWFGLMGTASVAIAVWLDRTKEVSIPSAYFWTVGIIALVIAFYRAWKQERDRNTKLQTKLNKLREKLDGQKPRLKPIITGFVVYWPPGCPDDIFLIINAEIRNHGAPSFADAYRVFVTISSERYEGKLLYFEHFPIKEDYVIRGEDNLIHKIGSIGRNDRITGHIIAAFSGLTASEFDGSEILLMVKDGEGFPYECSEKLDKPLPLKQDGLGLPVQPGTRPQKHE